MKTYGEVAIAFASALVAGDFGLAHGMLSPALRKELTPKTLREKYYGMFRGYSDSQPTAVWYDERGSLDDWPAKEPGDAGSAYVGLENEDEGLVEAVTVTVVKIDDALLIRKIEWGRP